MFQTGVTQEEGAEVNHTGLMSTKASPHKVFRSLVGRPRETRELTLKLLLHIADLKGGGCEQRRGSLLKITYRVLKQFHFCIIFTLSP